MRPPEQSAHLDAALCEVAEDFGDLGAGPVEALVGVALPVREVHPVAALEAAQLTAEAAEVVRPVDEDLDVIPRRPSRAVGAAAVDPGRRIAAFPGSQEPLVE